MDKNTIQNYLYLNINLFLVIYVSSRNIISKTLDAKKILTKIIFKKISRKKAGFHQIISYLEKKIIKKISTLLEQEI